MSRNVLNTRNTFCGTWYLPHSRVHRSIAELCTIFGDSAINKGQIAYFSLRMRKTVFFSTFCQNLTSPSCSPTQISYMIQEFWRFVHKYGPNCIFFIAHAQNGLIPTSCQKSDVTVVFSPRFPITRGNFGDWAINTGQIAYFSLRMRETLVILLLVKNLT